jgi:hypothetical protein
MQPSYGAVKLRCLLVITTKPGIIKIILNGVLEGSNGELLLVLICVNDLDSNTSNAIGIKATLFAFKSTILVTVSDLQDLIFNIDRIMEISCPGFIKTY